MISAEQSAHPLEHCKSYGLIKNRLLLESLERWEYSVRYLFRHFMQRVSIPSKLPFIFSSFWGQ